MGINGMSIGIASTRTIHND